MTDRTSTVTWWAEGTWTGVVTDRAMMLLPSQVSEELVERLWWLLRGDEASLTQALEELVTGTGGRLASVPDFALVVRAADDMLHVALRGAVQLEVDGKVLDALSVTTWLETAFNAPRTVVASAPERPGSVRRPVTDAVVLAGSLAIGADGDRGSDGSRGEGGQSGASGPGREEDGDTDPDPAGLLGGVVPGGASAASAHRDSGTRPEGRETGPGAEPSDGGGAPDDSAGDDSAGDDSAGDDSAGDDSAGDSVEAGDEAGGDRAGGDRAVDDADPGADSTLAQPGGHAAEDVGEHAAGEVAEDDAASTGAGDVTAERGGAGGDAADDADDADDDTASAAGEVTVSPLLAEEASQEATTGPVEAGEAAPDAADASLLVLNALAEVAPRAGGVGGLEALRADAPGGSVSDSVVPDSVVPERAAGGPIGGEPGASTHARDGVPGGEAAPGRDEDTAPEADLAVNPAGLVRRGAPEPSGAGTSLPTASAAGAALPRTRRARRLDTAPSRRSAGRHSWEPTVVSGGSAGSVPAGGSLGASSLLSPLAADIPDPVGSPEAVDAGHDSTGGVALVALPSQPQEEARADGRADGDADRLPTQEPVEEPVENRSDQVPGDHDGHTITSLPEELSEELRAELLSQGVTPGDEPSARPGTDPSLPAVGSRGTLAASAGSTPSAGSPASSGEPAQPRVASASRVAPHGDHDGHTVSGLPEDLVGELISLVGGAPGPSQAASPVSPAVPSTPLSPAVPAPAREPEVRVVLSAVCGNGHPNPTNYTVCRECGADLNRPAKSVACPPLGRLVTSSGDRIDLDRPVLVGRNPAPAEVASSSEVPVRLLAVPSPNQLVSRNHILIDLDAWSVLAQDLGNCNGTILNRDGEAPVRLASSSPVLLRSGDALDVGDGQILTFENLP